MIYFDNCATGGFKPQAVYDAVSNVTKYLSANPGRSGHRLSVAGAGIMAECRSLLAKNFNGSAERVIFTKNCTEALNLGIFGCIKKGGHVITTVYEHNSVLRPLCTLEKKGLITLTVVAPSENLDIADAIEREINIDTFLIVTTAVSNVTGEALPINKIGKLAKDKDILYIVDGAQGGGHIRIDIKRDNISMLALAGHKGLYGVQGSGALVIADGVEIEPLIYGGTGSESFSLSQPDYYPEKLESGTHNLPAVAALNEGARYAFNNLDNFANHLLERTEYIINAISSVRGITCYSKPNPVGIVSFTVNDMPSGEVADKLNADYDIAVRGGLHCAPLTHKFLNTFDGGLVRVSLAPQNSAREISLFLRAVREIMSG